MGLSSKIKMKNIQDTEAGKEEIGMECPKCGGTIIFEEIVGEFGEIMIPDIHCLQCARRFFDPTTEQDRRDHRKLKYDRKEARREG